MPKLFGLNLVGVLVASVLFFLVGWLWYGVLFEDAYMAAMDLPADAAGGSFDIWMAGGFLITLMQVIGIGLVLKWKGGAGLGGAVTTAVVLWFFFALPFCSYAYFYMPDHDPTMLMIDATHLLAGWVVSAVVLALIK